MNIEVCVENSESIHVVNHSGVERIELCSALAVGGLTPCYGLLKSAVKIAQMPIAMMIRPRAGDFLFSRDEVAMMVDDIQMARELGVHCVVIGALTERGEIDIATTQRLVEAAGPMEVTFHRAFDVCANPQTALETLIDLGCTRLLTSGQAPSAWLGRELIAKLVDQAHGRISIMAGAGVSAQNAKDLLAVTHADELHLSAKRFRYSAMARQSAVAMGKSADDDQRIMVTDGEELAKLRQSLGLS
ncbi:copper homeostasis protein CutC [Pasteurellaceae bacterium HPA106]|uniref:copper homeostasis protein CutC n=1 Tax=Spirabiliibacterium pneumoniae TaxID=221400 RepID=UPI001AACCE07|nr:copper homeostasis protein CutC [Spirabiliibacterium pneumoniae]MBE2895898.1 copper homeostasis protein CutC [Spirabiliibacterium pneumoniae]